MFFRKKKSVDEDSFKESIIIEDCKEMDFNKNSILMIIICTLLLLPLIYVMTELLINCSSVRLYITIFGFSLISILVTCLIMNLVSILFIKDNYIIDDSLDKYERILLDKQNNNRLRNNLLFSSFIVFCSFFAVLIASVIVIMILM